MPDDKGKRVIEVVCDIALGKRSESLSPKHERQAINFCLRYAFGAGVLVGIMLGALMASH